jgi:hypothetical protein
MMEPELTDCEPGTERRGGVVTVKCSQALPAAMLLASPLYIAFQLNFPSVGNVCEDEEGTTLLVTVTVDTIVADPVQSGEENWLYVSVPPAPNPPVKVAEPDTALPFVITPAESTVVTAGVASLTAKGSQAPDATLLFGSPLYDAWNE